MPTCWAAPLGGCDGGFSQEHLVSQSLWPGARIFVTGFSWCRDKPKEIPARSLKAHILCREHNNALSPIDAAGGRAFDRFRDAGMLLEKRRASGNRAWSPQTFVIADAEKVERWFLKTMLNLVVAKPGSLVWRSSGKPAADVPLGILRLAFGLEPFQAPMGLYTGAVVGEPFHLSESILFSPLEYDGAQIVGGVFYLWGWRFVLHLEPHKLPSDLLAHLAAVKSQSDVGGLQYHIKGLNYNIDTALSHTVAFKWDAPAG